MNQNTSDLLVIIAIVSILTLVTTACGQNSDECKVQPDGRTLICEGGTLVVPEAIDGQDGATGPQGEQGIQGEPGLQGEPGPAGVFTTQTEVAPKDCSEVLPGIFVQNLQQGQIFDVYLEKTCDDETQEVCDNVATSSGGRNPFGVGNSGSSTTCALKNLLFFGQRLDNDAILLTILELQ